MITPELQKKIDEKWDACWPLSQLKPVIILDLISYLFFYKIVSENKLAFQKSENFNNAPSSNLVEPETIGWEVFKNLGTKSMHEIFTQKNGVINSLKNLGNEFFFNEYLKSDLLLTPTPKSLAKSVEIIKIMEIEGRIVQSAIFEYLINKTEIISSSGQIFLPEYISTLMVSVLHPESKDVILDPTLGNGSLLVSCAKYISKENELKDKNLNNFNSQRFLGVETDASNLRIGAMNMVLNGIENPNVKNVEPAHPSGFIPSVIVSDLIFAASENTMTVEGDSIKEAARKEIVYLNYILNESRSGTRVAIVVPAFILYNADTEIKKLRQDIIDNFKLKSIIYLEDKNIPLFFGAAILIFSKETPAPNDRVWLYKLKRSKKGADNSVKPDADFNEEEFAIILNHLKNKSIYDEANNMQGIYIEADEIKSNNYNLNYNEYNLFKRQKNFDNLTENNSAEKKVLNNDNKEYASTVTTEKVTVDSPKKSGKKYITLVTILILACCATFGSYWFFYLKKSQPLKKEEPNISISNIAATKDTIALNTSVPSDTVQKINNEPNENPNDTNEKYTVISKAYFYSSPNDNSRKNIYINHWSNAILTPGKEKNGFIFTVYNDKMGQTLKGWLNKKDLEILH